MIQLLNLCKLMESFYNIYLEDNNANADKPKNI